MCLLYVTRQNIRQIQHREPDSRAGSENLRRLSLLSDMSRPIVGYHSTHLTPHPWPGRTCSSRPSGKDLTHTVESSLAGANCASFGEKLRPRMAS